MVKQKSINLNGDCIQCGGDIYLGDKVGNNGKMDIPDHVKRKHSNCTAIVNGEVYVNGYERMKDGTWKRSLKAFWHCYF